MSVALLAILFVAGRMHWSAGLLAGSAWIGWVSWRRIPISFPRNWGGWGVAAAALILSSALSNRPSGLAWLGLLQWLSLIVGVLAVQDLVRREAKSLDFVFAGILVLGLLDMGLWTRDLVVDHWEWWTVRVDTLPTFPFRIRLFGGHGSTQAATWLSILLLILDRWGIPRCRGIVKVALVGILVWSACLLGFCDSRLAMGGLLVAVVVIVAGHGFQWRLALVTFLPNLIWWARDLIHPSRIATGGGGDQGAVQVALVGMVWLLGMSAWTVRGLRIHVGLRRRVAMSLAFLVATTPVWFMQVAHRHHQRWATGRLEFWRCALDSWKSEPILGAGPWSFPWRYSLNHDWFADFLPMHPHNAILEIAIAGGVLLMVGLAWATFDVVVSAWRSTRSEGPIYLTAIVLAFSMAFDSPFSSPQLFLVCILVCGIALARLPRSSTTTASRAAIFLPLLVMVPLAYAFEGIAGKTALTDAAQSIGQGRWQQGANQILQGAPNSSTDPQWVRNSLMARTALGWNQRDSLEVLETAWESQVHAGARFLPDRIHLAAVRKRLGRDVDSVRFEADLRILGRMGLEKRVKLGEVPSQWRNLYPTDSQGYWLRRLAACSTKSCASERRWMALWFRTQIEPFSIAEAKYLRALGRNPRRLEIPSGREEYLFGSRGARWAFIPQVSQWLMAQKFEEF